MANLPNVDCKYGAPMGRRSVRAVDPGQSMKFRLSRVYLDSGGYDKGGAYWGFGRRLYQAEAEAPGEYWSGPGGDSDFVTMYLRADGREDAKEQIRAKYPNARFYR